MNMIMKSSHSTERSRFPPMIPITVTIISKFSTYAKAGTKGKAAEKKNVENK
ncbi:hypothetical protein ACIQZD_01175 [Peribacillus sp. NPDC096447]|uniref:hypothetical protein n=1 Tax=Peribacillus sp. NPDC096447 TaxID=3364394 RepID=UPI00382D1F19